MDRRSDVENAATCHVRGRDSGSSSRGAPAPPSAVCYRGPSHYHSRTGRRPPQCRAQRRPVTLAAARGYRWGRQRPADASMTLGRRKGTKGSTVSFQSVLIAPTNPGVYDESAQDPTYKHPEASDSDEEGNVVE